MQNKKHESLLCIFRASQRTYMSHYVGVGWLNVWSLHLLLSMMNFRSYFWSFFGAIFGDIFGAIFEAVFGAIFGAIFGASLYSKYHITYYPYHIQYHHWHIFSITIQNPCTVRIEPGALANNNKLKGLIEDLS